MEKGNRGGKDSKEVGIAVFHEGEFPVCALEWNRMEKHVAGMGGRCERKER